MKMQTADETDLIMAEERQNYRVRVLPGQPFDPAIVFAQPGNRPPAPKPVPVSPNQSESVRKQTAPMNAPSTSSTPTSSTSVPAKPLSNQAAYWARKTPAERTAEQLRRRAVRVARRNGQPGPGHPKAPPSPAPAPSVPPPCESVAVREESVPFIGKVSSPFKNTIAVIQAYRSGLQSDVQAIDRLLTHLGA